MKHAAKWVLAGTLGLLCASCSLSHQGQLFDLQDGAVSTVQVRINLWSSKGKFSGTLPDGEAFTGTYRTITEQGYQHGVAIGKGDRGTIISCDYEVEGTSSVIGRCLSNKGRQYRMVM